MKQRLQASSAIQDRRKEFEQRNKEAFKKRRKAEKAAELDYKKKLNEM